jgi:cytochrome P450
MEAEEKFSYKARPASIFEAIDQSSQPECEKTAPRLIQEGVTLLFAGGETVARSLTHTIFYLLDNPDIYAKVKREIDEATPEGEQIPSYQTLRGLPWLVGSFDL